MLCLSVGDGLGRTPISAYDVTNRQICTDRSMGRTHCEDHTDNLMGHTIPIAGTVQMVRWDIPNAGNNDTDNIRYVEVDDHHSLTESVKLAVERFIGRIISYRSNNLAWGQ